MTPGIQRLFRYISVDQNVEYPYAPLLKNENGVPQYPKGHAGRLLVVLAAITKLEHASAVSIAAYTGLSQGNIDVYVSKLNDEFGTWILKEKGRYWIESWGPILKEDGVLRALVSSEFDRTTASADQTLEGDALYVESSEA